MLCSMCAEVCYYKCAVYNLECWQTSDCVYDGEIVLWISINFARCYLARLFLITSAKGQLCNSVKGCILCSVCAEVCCIQFWIWLCAWWWSIIVIFYEFCLTLFGKTFSYYVCKRSALQLSERLNFMQCVCWSVLYTFFNIGKDLTVCMVVRYYCDF